MWWQLSVHNSHAFATLNSWRSVISFLLPGSDSPLLHLSLPGHHSRSYQAPIKSQTLLSAFCPQPYPTSPFPFFAILACSPGPGSPPQSPFPGSVLFWAPPKPQAHRKPHWSHLGLKPLCLSGESLCLLTFSMDIPSTWPRSSCSFLSSGKLMLGGF